jgi:hypothetical protein
MGSKPAVILEVYVGRVIGQQLRVKKRHIFYMIPLTLKPNKICIGLIGQEKPDKMIRHNQS